ncbi:hemin uptake protein HemP [Pandoraea terrae]|uniref:Hemin uptake protein HemP n=1 Tax=Pandoraea terrae TaxID=1537710 RepID=A0A5E4VIZ2_9BURK|nr:hemin uptake protein HemP [Pandoraea terrae]VVE11005.1 hemin uptake protein HemP [Pandoraea terrae]
MSLNHTPGRQATSATAPRRTLSVSRSNATAEVSAKPVHVGNRANGRALTSEHLLQGTQCVNILHNGQTYQLRATRYGKLILTK